MGKRIDLTGKRFGRLTVVSLGTPRRKGRLMWNCVCDCGKTRAIMSDSLLQGRTNSCGCIRIEKSVFNLKHQQRKEKAAA